MRVLYLALVFQVHAQLQCDKYIIHTTIGQEINVRCIYTQSQSLFSKKYWCLGESRNTCEVLMDTDGFKTARLKTKAWIQENRFRTFHIRMTQLQLEDTGIYWAGIDKLYADLMVRIKVMVTDEAVSKPKVWLDGSPVETCQGQAVLLRCQTEKGTNVKYSWFREARPQDVLQQSSADLLLRCDSLTEDAQYVCLVQNAVSREQSKPISLYLLQAGKEKCVYSLTSDELLIEHYDCKTTTTSTMISTSISEEISSSIFVPQSSSAVNQSVCCNQNCTENFDLRSWSGLPLWYDILRWLLFVAMIITFGFLHSYTETSRSTC